MSQVAATSPGAFLLDRKSYPARARRAMATSIGAHVLLLLILAIWPRTELHETPITEISFLEATEAAAPAAGGEARAMQAQMTPASPAPAGPDVRFERLSQPADISPRPQTTEAFGDRLSERLSSLQARAAERVAALEETRGPAAWGGSSAGSASLGGGSSPLALERGSGSGGTAPALTLSRGGSGRGHAPAIVSTDLPGGGTAVAPATESETHAQRQLAGATLTGPLADRAILHMVKPPYPEWAKREAVEATVTLYFLVSPDGAVREGVVVQKTAGFQDFDESAREALRAWRFQALRAGRTGDQWGTITFRFRLRDAG